MTRTTNARIAGFTFLFYIAAGIGSMILFGRAAGAGEATAKLANIALHLGQVRAVFVLGLLQSFCAIVLAVTLYAITREEDSDIAMLGLTFRVGEGLIGASLPSTLIFLWLATVSGTAAPDSSGARTLATFLFKLEGSTSLLAATFFAVGSTLFGWLLLRGRMIPVTLAWLGVLASALLVICVPMQAIGLLGAPFTYWMWLPMAVFEVVFAILLLVRGGAMPIRYRPI